MKFFISADIEGVTGVTHWDETDMDKAEYAAAREQMTAEVVAACEGALQAGVTEIWIKDAHDNARNILAARLPREARLIRGWSGHPFCMVQELDNTFHSYALVGYHSGAGMNGSPLAHTMTGGLTAMTINGRPTTEFLIFAYAGAYLGVPLVFVSGDQALCGEVTAVNAHIHTVATKEGVGNSTINLHPDLAVERIRANVASALPAADACRISLPDRFDVELFFRNMHHAYHAGFYPGAAQFSPTGVRFAHNDYFEVLRFLSFVL